MNAQMLSLLQQMTAVVQAQADAEAKKQREEEEAQQRRFSLQMEPPQRQSTYGRYDTLTHLFTKKATAASSEWFVLRKSFSESPHLFKIEQTGHQNPGDDTPHWTVCMDTSVTTWDGRILPGKVSYHVYFADVGGKQVPLYVTTVDLTASTPIRTIVRF